MVYNKVFSQAKSAEDAHSLPVGDKNPGRSAKFPFCGANPEIGRVIFGLEAKFGNWAQHWSGEAEMLK